MKKMIVWGNVLAIMLLLCACAKKASPLNTQQPEEKTTINVGSLKGPAGISMTFLMEQNEKGLTANQYDFHLAGAPDEITGKLISGELDAAAIPPNLASVLYNKTEGKIKMAAITTLGVLYVLEDGDAITSVADLKGKTLYATGKASVPEYALSYILRMNGIGEEDITIEYKTEHGELAALMASGAVKLGMLPEPHVTMAMLKNENLRIALDLTREWEKAAGKNDEPGGALVMGCLVVRDDFLTKNKDTFDVFLTEYKQSAEYANANILDTASLAEKFQIIPQAAVAEKAIPNCSIVFIEGDEMKEKCENFLRILLEAEPKSIGGGLPDENFYYKK